MYIYIYIYYIYKKRIGTWFVVAADVYHESNKFVVETNSVALLLHLYLIMHRIVVVLHLQTGQTNRVFFVWYRMTGVTKCIYIYINGDNEAG